MSMGVNTLFKIQTCKRCNEKMEMVHGDFDFLNDDKTRRAYGAVLECPKCGMRYREKFLVEITRKGGTLE